MSSNPHKHLRTEVDYAGRTDCQPVYVGYAEPLSDTAKPVWQIMRLDYDGSGRLLSRLWAEGDIYFSHVWDNRTLLTYS